MDADGFLSITGRIKEMLIIGGENVFPREIEEVLDRHPSVKSSAVIGAPDESRGEVALAFVELVDDAVFDDKRYTEDEVDGKNVLSMRVVSVDKVSTQRMAGKKVAPLSSCQNCC